MAWGDAVWRVSRWLTWWPSWISEQNDFNNSKSSCGPNASHQVWDQSDLGFSSRCGFKIVKMAAQAAILDSQMEWFKQFWISMLRRCFPSSFSSIWPTVWEEMSFEEYQDGRRGSYLGYWSRTILAILNLCVTVMPPIKFWLNPTWFVRRCHLKNFKMATMAAILDIRMEWNNFSSSESLCHCDASHQVLARSNLRFDVVWRISRCILDIGTERF